MVFRAPALGVLRLVRLDSMTAIYDRRSNATHVVSEIVPTVLEALGEGDADIPGLASRLGIEELDALAERLAELAASGLVEAL